MNFSKATKSEIISEYRKLQQELKACKRSVSESHNTPEVPTDLLGIAELLAELRSKSSDAVFSVRGGVCKDLIALKRLVEENNSAREYLQTTYGVSFGDDTVGELVQDFKKMRVEKDARQDDLFASLAKQKAAASDNSRARIKQRSEEFADQKDLRADAYNRTCSDMAYCNTERQEQDRVATEEIQAQADAKLGELRREFEEWRGSCEKELERRRSAVNSVDAELRSKTELLEASLNEARDKGEARATAFKLAETRRVRGTFESDIKHKRIRIRALQSESAQNVEALAVLKARLDKITSDVQTLSQTSINSKTKGASQALEVAERIALEQARSTNSTTSHKRS